MVVFHEIGECRVGDLDLIAKRYATRAEDRAAKDQLEGLGELGEALFELWDACEHQSTEAGIIAKDADLLECAFTAREYVETGHAGAQAWIDDIREALHTESAKRLAQALDDHSFTGWWR
jgi:putative hydrolase of HD superfamily